MACPSPPPLPLVSLSLLLSQSELVLVANAPVTYPQTRRLAVNTGMLLCALGYQLTELEDLLLHPTEWEKAGKFDEAVNRNPQAREAVSYFREYYMPRSRSQRFELMGTFLDHVFTLTADRKLQALFSASAPGIDVEDAEASGQTVILDCSGITDPHAKRFALLWVFETLYEHLKSRGRRPTPFGLMIDEFSALVAQTTLIGRNPLALRCDEFLAQYMRSNRIFVTCAFQSVDQIDEQLRQTVFRLGTIISGRAGSMREARVLADVLFRRDVNRVQHYKKVWGRRDTLSPLSSPLGSPLSSPLGFPRGFPLGSGYIREPEYFVLDYEPMYMGLDLQEEEAAGKIADLPSLEFFCRPAVREGEVSREVSHFSITQALGDPDTGSLLFPDPVRDSPRIFWLKRQLVQESGIPIAAILWEQGQRLSQRRGKDAPFPAQDLPSPLPARDAASSVKPPASPVPPADTIPPAGHQQTAGTSDGGKPITDAPTHPALSERERAYLCFLIQQPETPVSRLTKELGIGAAQAAAIRQRLIAKGLLLELTLRTGRTDADTPRSNRGRPLKYLVPGAAAYELVGKELPQGRGGMLHRQIQQLVAESARAKGYQAAVEYPLEQGGIVDVYLTKGTETIGVEVAVVSTPEREMSHLRACLAAGCTTVYGIFVDEKLMGRTGMLLQETLSGFGEGRE